MYVPSDDTFLLADCARQYHGMQALEIGIGSGLITKILEKNFESVVGTDIDFAVLQHFKGRSSAMLVCCDAASALSAKFDLIVSNPPYLPDDEIKDQTVHGGPVGIETTVHFVKSALPLLAQDGRMLIVVSSLADSSALDRIVSEMKLRKKVVREKRLFYETLSVVELSR
jgi:release factor glutamine methyltransferase